MCRPANQRCGTYAGNLPHHEQVQGDLFPHVRALDLHCDLKRQVEAMQSKTIKSHPDPRKQVPQKTFCLSSYASRIFFHANQEI